MGSRGRKSKTDLAIVTPTVTDRPEPAPGLTEEQTFEWLRITNSMPADEFTTAQLPMLEQYVKHRVEARHIGQMIADVTGGDSDELDIVRYDKLLKMQERETRALASLAVRLGIAKTTKATSGSGNVTRKPWE